MNKQQAVEFHAKNREAFVAKHCNPNDMAALMLIDEAACVVENAVSDSVRHEEYSQAALFMVLAVCEAFKNKGYDGWMLFEYAYCQWKPLVLVPC